MTLIEKIARIICAGSGNDPDFHHKSMNADWKYWREYEPLARVVIKAMREPTEGMMLAAYVEPVKPEKTWRRMIDAALKEEA